MRSVEWKTLGDICEIKGRIGFRGYTREDQVEKGNGAISLSPGNIFDSVLSYDSCTYITWEKYEESPEIMVSEGDIILCKTASVGKVARVKHLPEKATINPQLVLIKNIKTNPQYLFYVLDDNPFQTKIKGLAGVGSVPNVSQAKLSAIQIPIPPLLEQNRIVGILDTFTSSIENLKEQIAQRRKQYEYYRDQLLDLEGKEGVEMKTIGEICDTLSGFPFDSSQFSDEGVRLMRGMNVKRGYFDFSEDNNKYWSSSVGLEKYLLEANDIIISMDGSLVGRSFCYLKEEHLPLLLVQRVARIRTLENFKYIYFNITNRFPDYVDKKKTAGAIPHISMKDINNFIIPLPSKEEQSRIVSILDTFEASIANLEAQLKEREKQYEYYRNKLLTFE